MTTLPTPVCHGMVELPSAFEERCRLNERLLSEIELDWNTLSPISKHIALGLAITTGSAFGELPPSREQCLAAFVVPNSAGLTAGARAWTKHAHRSGHREGTSWWGNPRGPVSSLNAGALAMFEKIMQHSSWRNLHWLPHVVMVYEIRVVEGYGMRWSQNRSVLNARHEWVFRGFVEPMMQDGHELRWRH
ncbi:hypothetical protein ACEPAI_8646 [Sanghuangporus weigelae]